MKSNDDQVFFYSINIIIFMVFVPRVVTIVITVLSVISGQASQPGISVNSGCLVYLLLVGVMRASERTNEQRGKRIDELLIVQDRCAQLISTYSSVHISFTCLFFYFHFRFRFHLSVLLLSLSLPYLRHLYSQSVNTASSLGFLSWN